MGQRCALRAATESFIALRQAYRGCPNLRPPQGTHSRTCVISRVNIERRVFSAIVDAKNSYLIFGIPMAIRGHCLRRSAFDRIGGSRRCHFRYDIGCKLDRRRSWNYQALAAIYRHLAGVPGQTAIKTITLMLLEWNRAGLLIAIVLLLQLLVLLLRGAFIAGTELRSMQHQPRLALVTAFRKAYRGASFADTTVQIIAAILSLNRDSRSPPVAAPTKNAHRGAVIR